MESRVPHFSVIIPVFNRAGAIEDTIRSVLMQSEQSFEILVVDDGSTDDLVSVVSSIGDERVRLHRQENSGANVARNTGIDLATGRWVSFLDSDDRFLPDHLERAKAVLDSGVLAYCSSVWADRGNGRRFIKPSRPPRPTEPLSEYLCCSVGFLQTSTIVLDAALAKRVRFLDWLPVGQDVDFAIRLEAEGARLQFDPVPSVIWDDRKGSTRISNSSRSSVRERWLHESRFLLSPKATLGFTGWRTAKAYAEEGHIYKALKLFFTSLRAGVYSPSHASKVFLQIVLAGGGYQRLVAQYLGIRALAKQVTVSKRAN